MRIHLICFNKLKTPGMSDAVAEFVKRIGKYADFKTTELKSTQDPEKDGELIISTLSASKHSGTRMVWCLDETGSAMRTTEWGVQLKKLEGQAVGELTFCIGGSFGLPDKLLKSASKKISFGPQTLSHELARLVLVEQLYRALSLNEGHPYHKEG